MNVIARKPAPRLNNAAEYVIVDRGETTPHRFVSAVIDPQSLKFTEWYWGHYFETIEEALSHFNERGR